MAYTSEQAGDLLGYETEEIERQKSDKLARERAMAGLGAATAESTEHRDAAQQRADQLMGRTSPQMGTVSGFERQQGAQIGNVGVDQTMRNAQLSQAQRLTDMATGKAPSLAERQMREAQSRNLANLISANVSTQGGMGGAAMQRNLMRQGAAIGQDTSRMAGDLRLQEQLAAEQQLGGLVSNARSQDIGLRSQDIGLATAQAGLNQQANLANQQALLQQAGFDISVGQANLAAQLQTQEGIDRLTQFYLSQGMAMDEANRQARMQAFLVGEQARQADLNRSQERYLGEPLSFGQQVSSGIAQAIPATLGGAAQGAGSAIAGSGVDLKTDIRQQGLAKQPGVMQAALGVGRSAATPALNTARGYETAGGSGVGTSSRDAIRDAIMGNIGGFTSNRGIIAGSGQDLKTDIKDAGVQPAGVGDEIDNMYENLAPYTYEYKDAQRFGPGRHAGVMAEDLERAGPIGQGMVKENQQGEKVVDYGQGFAAMLAGQVKQHDEINALKEQLAQLQGTTTGGTTQAHQEGWPRTPDMVTRLMRNDQAQGWDDPIVKEREKPEYRLGDITRRPNASQAPKKDVSGAERVEGYTPSYLSKGDEADPESLRRIRDAAELEEALKHEAYMKASAEVDRALPGILKEQHKKYLDALKRVKASEAKKK